eukprot:scaffold536922_cov36-Prasinocladus_malaysianus.AAC.1
MTGAIDHDNISVGALDMEMIDIIDVGRELPIDDEQQLEEAIAERCEELSMHPENSMQAGVSDLMEEVAEAEQDEAIEAATPNSKFKPITPSKIPSPFDL